MICETHSGLHFGLEFGQAVDLTVRWPDGQVDVVYRGRVDLDQVPKNLSLLDAEEDELRRLAVPFRGRWEPRTEFETR